MSPPYLPIALALLLTLCLTTLTPAQNPQKPASDPKRDTTHVQAMIFDAGFGTSFLTDAARAYEQQHPGTQIHITGDPRIRDKIRVRILEGSYPDFSDAPLNYTALIRHGKILPLDDALDRPRTPDGKTWRDTFLPGSFERYSDNGQSFGVPLWYSIYGFYYNKALFREKGWQPPETWPQLLELCKKIHQDPGDIAPIAYQGQYSLYLHQIINTTLYQLGGPDYFNNVQLLEPGAFDHPHMVKTLTLVHQLAQKHFQPGAIGMSHTQAQLEFFRGKTAMVMCGTWLLNEMADQIPEDFEVGFFKYPMMGSLAPDAHDDPHAVAGGTGYFLVFSEGPNPHGAVEFLRFLTSPEQAAIIARSKNQPVAIKGVNETALPESLADIATILESTQHLFRGMPHDAYPDMGQPWADVRTAILEQPDFDPAAAAKQLENAARNIRAQALDPDHIEVRHRIKPAILLTLLAAGILYITITTALQIRKAFTPTQHPEQSGVRIRAATVITFLLPALLLYTTFMVVPSLSSFAWSTQRWDGLTDMQPAGLLHFYRLLYEDDGFWTALTNNLFLMFVIPIFVIPLALFLATCLARGVYGSTLFRIVFFFPNLLGIAAILLWQQMYNPAGGPINTALVTLGFESFQNFPWLSQQYLYYALIPMSVWSACGFNMILYLAAMQSIPHALYEAADIDGASPWKQFWTITLPLIWESLSVSIVFLVIAGMKAFEVIWLLTNQLPNSRTHVIGTLMVQSMFGEFRVGQAAAIAVLLFLMVFFGTAATLRLLKRDTVEL